MLEDGFGDIVGKARVGLGLTLLQLANVAQIEIDRLQLLEECEVEPTAVECQKLATALSLHHRALASIARMEYQPVVGQRCTSSVYSCKVSAMQANAYLLTVPSQAAALLIDPGGDVTGLLQIVEQNNLKLQGILLTHGHRDHTAGVDAVVKQLQIPVLAPPQEYAVTMLQPLTGSGAYQVGEIAVRALHCPGHTEHGHSFLIGDTLFTGDTLFAGSMGRTRSVTAYQQLLASGKQLLALPSSTIIFPGHGPATTVEQERIHNPFLAHAYSPSKS